MSGSRLKKPFDVLIQGAGPVGCVAALLANQRGLSVCMIDAQSENAYRGNAHYLNAYTLEILDLAGIDLTNLFTMKTTGDYAYAMAIGTNLQNIVCYKNLYEDHQIRDRYLHTGRYQGSANIRMSILYPVLLEAVKKSGIDLIWRSTIEAVNFEKKKFFVKTLIQRRPIRLKQRPFWVVTV